MWYSVFFAKDVLQRRHRTNDKCADEKVVMCREWHATKLRSNAFLCHNQGLHFVGAVHAAECGRVRAGRPGASFLGPQSAVW